MDPWWNPAVEVQAMDRIHRLGQHRPIVVKRMIIENSIESRIIELQNKKSTLDSLQWIRVFLTVQVLWLMQLLGMTTLRWAVSVSMICVSCLPCEFWGPMDGSL